MTIKEMGPVRVSPPASLSISAACLLIALAVVLPIDSLSAEELALRCDPIGPGSHDVELFFIDTSRKTVHWGKNPESGWYTNNKKYQEKTEDRPGTPNCEWCELPYIGCIYNVTEFVRISDDIIEFGKPEISTNLCGREGSKEIAKIHSSYRIDRTTGMFDYYGTRYHPASS